VKILDQFTGKINSRHPAQSRVTTKFKYIEIFLTPFDFAQGDRQTERSRSLITTNKD
jgi:hypothetical protein